MAQQLVRPMGSSSTLLLLAIHTAKHRFFCARDGRFASSTIPEIHPEVVIHFFHSLPICSSVMINLV